MGSKIRGRQRLVNCDSCGRRVPRDKAVSYERTSVFSTDMKTADDVRLMTRNEMHYCPSCAKSRGIYEKKKEQAIRRSQRAAQTQQQRPNWGGY